MHAMIRNASSLRPALLLVPIFALALMLLVHRRGYGPSVTRSRQAAVRSDLAEMRKVIENYTSDKSEAPGSLQDLVDAKYLRDVPFDPCTMKRDWVPVYGDVALDPDHKSNGIIGIRSAADGAGYHW